MSDVQIQSPVSSSGQSLNTASDHKALSQQFGDAPVKPNDGKAKLQKSADSFNTLGSLESDRWSQRGISSRVSLNNLTDKQQSEAEEDELKKCFWLHKVWYNCVLPGFLGIDKHRVVKKLSHEHPVSKQLVYNIVNYNNLIRSFITNGLLAEIKTLATQMYFPTGQIEADGLSVISADIWSATYLLLGIHRQLREPDFHYIRSAYSSLAWDSGQVYRNTLRFHQIFHEFTEHVVPLWNEIVKLTGVPEDYDFVPTNKNTIEALRGTASLAHSFKSKQTFKSRIITANSPPPPQLPSIRISDELVMQNKLGLRIVPERKSGLMSPEPSEQNFEDLEYGQQVDIIKELLHQPADILIHGRDALKLIGLNLLNDGAANRTSEISCNRAMKILRETLKLLYKEVKLTPSLRFDLRENVRATSEDIRSFLAYTQWVISKLSEFHSMMRLCYNFALLCFDLDLPSFDKVMIQEKMSEDMFKPKIVGGKSVDLLHDEQLKFKVISLTKLMTEAASSFISMQKQGGVDESFAWEDFYKTDYHLVLQRLPLRLGYNLLQFSAKYDSKLIIKQRVGTATLMSASDEQAFQADSSRLYIPRSDNMNQNA